MKRIRNKINRIYTKHLLKTCQHVFVHNRTSITYLLAPRKSADTLVVVFSGMGQIRASYNYLDLLNGMNCHRLYILDDIGDDVLGCYYLGTNGNNQVELAVKALITEIAQRLSVRKLVFCGSSKGGYAALNFGLEYPKSTIIAGAPQYKLGYHLTHRKSPQLLNVILGECTPQTSIDALDRKIQKKLEICGESHGGKVYLHYSSKEHTYGEHIQYLVSDLQKSGIQIFKDIATYTEHDDVAMHFPPYLKCTLKGILS